ncbi:MAG: ABC transporter ATP-binding protein [Burkholderiaceae bacterium]|jgi:iron complex transport system ATP-binding protein
MNCFGPLEVCGLVYGHRNRPINKPLTIHLEGGFIYALLGANGIGKSTLLRTLLGLHPRIDGGIKVCEQPLEALNDQQRAKVMSYVPQAHATGFGYTVLDMVLMATSANRPAFSAPSGSDVANAVEALRMTGADNLTDKYFDELSGGQRQLVLIARALHQGAHFILLDEPCSHLDFGNQHRILCLMQSLSDRGHGVIFTTHDPRHAEQIAHRVVMLHLDGSLEIDDPMSCISPASLSRLYGLEPNGHLPYSRLR